MKCQTCPFFVNLGCYWESACGEARQVALPRQKTGFYRGPRPFHARGQIQVGIRVRISAGGRSGADRRNRRLLAVRKLIVNLVLGRCDVIGCDFAASPGKAPDNGKCFVA